MDIIVLDFETFYSDEFTLSKLTTEEYVRDPRFEVLGASIRWPQGSTCWYDRDRPTLDTTLNNIDWENTGVVAHHAHFDGLILAHHFGIKPKQWFCTLSMARMLIGNHLSVGLDNLAKHFGLGAKTIDYNAFRGRRYADLTPQARQMLGDGCNHDCDLTWDLFCRLAGRFPAEEFALVDTTVRMFTEPRLVGNTLLLGEIWQQEQARKAALLAELGVTGEALRSNEVFADLLRAEGVEPAMKPGKENRDGSEKWIYAFAKSDDFMRDLVDDEDERVATLAEARLSEKSNIVQSRTERLGYMSTRGPLCVYLNYCGAHTTRWSGGDKVNWQNRKSRFRDDPDAPGRLMDKAIEAPAGHMVVVNDASQIECRLLNEVAGQEDVIERFRNHEDPYIGIASKFYGFEVTKAHELERGTGKQLELSCGYGAGGPTIQATAKKGTYGPPVYLEDADALRARDLYRSTHPAVVALWQEAGEVLKKLYNGMQFEWGPLDIKDKRIWLPNGSPLIYETLEWATDDKGEQGWRLRTRRNGWTKMYGAKLVENVIQALARLHVSQAWLRCTRVGLDIVSMEHDKLIAVVREHEAQDAFKFMQAEMARPPEWLPNVPLDSEGYISRTFAKPEKVK